MIFIINIKFQFFDNKIESLIVYVRDNFKLQEEVN